MIVEIINVGTELLLGEIVNTNATIIQKFCKDMGFDVFYQTVVGDNSDRLKECLDIAFKRGANCIITTGGIGPTQDDVTKSVCANFLGIEMEMNKEELQKVIDKVSFLNNNLPVANSNYQQGYYPIGSTILENPIGTANGCVMTKDNKMIVNLPGPPKELQFMLNDSVHKFFTPFQKEVLFSQDITTFGIGESNLATILEEVIEKQTDVSIALYAGEEFVRVRLASKAFNIDDANIKILPVKKVIEDIIGEYIYDLDKIKDYLNHNMLPYSIVYDSDYRLPISNDTLPHDSDIEVKLYIHVTCHKKELGDVIEIHFKDDKHVKEVCIPMLFDSNLSSKKLEAKFLFYLYVFLTENDKNNKD